MLKVAILAPIASSLYSRLVVHRLAQIDTVDVTGIVVRTPWTWQRIRSEVKRDGSRLIKKVFAKMVQGDRRYADDDAMAPPALKREWGLEANTLAELSKHFDLPYLVVKDHNDNASLNFLKRSEPDLIVFTGGGLIRQALLDIPSFGVLNCHMGILPEYRGMDVVEWPFVEQSEPRPWLGLTLHLMDQGVDTGPILSRCQVATAPGDTF